MKKDYTKLCWYCGSKDMEPDERGVRCRKCGATWNQPPVSHRTSIPGYAIGNLDSSVPPTYDE